MLSWVIVIAFFPLWFPIYALNTLAISSLLFFVLIFKNIANHFNSALSVLWVVPLLINSLLSSGSSVDLVDATAVDVVDLAVDVVDDAAVVLALDVVDLALDVVDLALDVDVVVVDLAVDVDDVVVAEIEFLDEPTMVSDDILSCIINLSISSCFRPDTPNLLALSNSLRSTTLKFWYDI